MDSALIHRLAVECGFEEPDGGGGLSSPYKHRKPPDMKLAALDETLYVGEYACGVDVHKLAHSIRRETLEEAAKVCEEYDCSVCDTGYGPSTSDLADAIRALIVKE